MKHIRTHRRYLVWWNGWGGGGWGVLTVLIFKVVFYNTDRTVVTNFLNKAFKMYTNIIMVFTTLAYNPFMGFVKWSLKIVFIALCVRSNNSKIFLHVTFRLKMNFKSRT